MRRGIIVLCLLLALTSASAAEVKTQSSGFSRGSLENVFPFIEGDTTIVEGVLPNDFIVIEYPGGEYRMFFTHYINDEWQYDIWRGERRLTIAKGERKELDIDSDGSPDLVMEFTRQNLKKGTFTFSPIATEPEQPPPEQPVREEEQRSADTPTATGEKKPVQAQPVTAPEPPAPSLPAAPPEAAVIPPGDTSEPAKPDVVSYKLAVTLVVLIVVLIYFVTAKPIGLASFGKRRRKKASKASEDEPVAESSPRHEIVSRRRLRR